ncbi:MAG TPA: 3'-5' exonuclease [bacterium]|nr:3'-5' exonuclease [bacterium]HPW39624.1 3'-5' exonuclease [bacterium]HQA64224.1 3'-5' exonuclease [bacterium]
MTEKYQNFLKTEFVVFDIETSGLDPLKDEVLEIAGLKLIGEQEAARFEALIQPTRPVLPEVEKIHGLNEIFLLVNGRRNEEVISDFLNFVGEAIIVGHNIRGFDWLFILEHLKKKNQPLPANKIIDTLELSRQLLSLATYNLSSVASHFGLEHKNAHRAMPDVEINTKVFLELMKQLLNPPAA